MRLLTPLGALFWIALIVIGLPLVRIMLLVARARTGLRTIEGTHITDPEQNFHEDYELKRSPSELQKLVTSCRKAAEENGFSELVTGRRMRLHAGRANTYYHILVSKDRQATAEFSHVRVARVFALWPVPLPFSSIIGPSVCNYSFETLFSDEITLITCSLKSMATLKMPSLRINMVPQEMDFSERWKSHLEWIEKVKAEGPRDVIPLIDKEAYFKKGAIQRRQIAADQQRKMRELREKSKADLWDKKEDQ